MSFDAKVPTILSPQPLRVFDKWHPTSLVISTPDPNGAIRVTMGLVKVSLPTPDAPYEVSKVDPPVLRTLPDLRPFMATDQSLTILVVQLQQKMQQIAEAMGWIPAFVPAVPSGEEFTPDITDAIPPSGIVPPASGSSPTNSDPLPGSLP